MCCCRAIKVQNQYGCSGRREIRLLRLISESLQTKKRGFLFSSMSTWLKHRNTTNCSLKYLTAQLLSRFRLKFSAGKNWVQLRELVFILWGFQFAHGLLLVELGHAGQEVQQLLGADFLLTSHLLLLDEILEGEWSQFPTQRKKGAEIKEDDPKDKDMNPNWLTGKPCWSHWPSWTCQRPCHERQRFSRAGASGSP